MNMATDVTCVDVQRPCAPCDLGSGSRLGEEMRVETDKKEAGYEIKNGPHEHGHNHYDHAHDLAL